MTTLIHSRTMGVYLGNCMGLGFLNLVTIGQ